MSTDVPVTALELARNFLADFQYKPDTVFYLGNPTVYGVSIVASRKIPDSRNPAHPLIHVRAELPVSELQLRAAHDPRELLQVLVHDWIRRLEVHEVDEWFRIGDTLPYDPHLHPTGENHE